MRVLKFLFLTCLIGLLASCNGEQHPNGATPPIDPPRNIIPIDQANTIYKDYGAERAAVLDDIVNKANPKLTTKYEATRFVTMDYQALKDYIAFIDQESEKANITPKGLRVYLSKMPEGGNTPKPGQETVFFNPVAAFDGIDGDISYAIATSATGEVSAVTVGSVIEGKGEKAQGANNLLLQGGGIQSLAGDDLQWPPPPHPGDPNDYH